MDLVRENSGTARIPETATDPSQLALPLFTRLQSKIGLRWAWLTMAISLGVTGLAYNVVYTDSQQAISSQFEFRKTEIQDVIDRRMAAYKHTLQGALGLIRASQYVNRQK